MKNGHQACINKQGCGLIMVHDVLICHMKTIVEEISNSKKAHCTKTKP